MRKWKMVRIKYPMVKKIVLSLLEPGELPIMRVTYNASYVLIFMSLCFVNVYMYVAGCWYMINIFLMILNWERLLSLALEENHMLSGYFLHSFAHVHLHQNVIISWQLNEFRYSSWETKKSQFDST